MAGRYSALPRRWSRLLHLERLEDRTTPAVSYYPSQILHAYGFDQVPEVGGALPGTGQTIAIVDAYYDPTAQSDLQTFDANPNIRLANPSFSQVSQSGGSPSSFSQNSGWAGETSLDIEWAHAIAPGANILLVEAQDSSDANLFAAVNFARSQTNVSVVSMSWGGGEFSGENGSPYTTDLSTPSSHNNVAFVASSGDGGAGTIFPSISPRVLSVGGTSLNLSGGNYGSESAWNDSGGGASSVFSKPTYQTAYSGTQRGNPDVSYDADPSTGFNVYNSADGGWEVVGGTSAGAPQWAGLIADADQGRVAEGLGTLDGFSQLLPAIYSLPETDFNDIASGSNGHPATTGYDLATGLGTPKAQLVIPALISYGAASAAPAITKQPTSQTADVGQTATFTATASGNPAPSVQWQVSINGGAFANISGATSSSYTTPVLDATFSGNQYRAVFTNGVGSPATTSAVTLTIATSAPSITLQPVNQIVNVGQTATFTASAIGNPSPTVQWQVSVNGGPFTNIGGATSNTYTTPPTDATFNGNQYQAVFTNGVGTPATTSAVSLTLSTTGPAITTQPTSQTATNGETVTFTAAASGSPAPTVQWQFNINGGHFFNVSGATSTTYTFTATSANSGESFRAVFTNSAGGVITNAATLAVVAPVTVGSVQVGDGLSAADSSGFAERSEVRSITITFSGPVSFAGCDAAAAFQLNQIGDTSGAFTTPVAVANSIATVSTNASGQTVVTLTFSTTGNTNAQNTGPIDSVSAQNGASPSLNDGQFSLTINSASVIDANGATLDGQNTGVAGSGNYLSPTDTQGGGAGQVGLFRLFGDVDGSGVDDQLNLAAFRGAFNSSSGDSAYVSYLDADNSGTIDQLDLAQFRSRFNASVF